MAKSKKHMEAIQLRRTGKSVKDIARLLGVSKSSASIWCADVILTRAQVDYLHGQMIRGGYRGRLKGALMQKERKELKIRNYQNEGVRKIGSTSNRDLLLLGLGLHLGEGNKLSNKFQFTNSNPEIITLILFWLEKCFNVKRESLILTIFINQSHMSRASEVKSFWRRTTKTKEDQFRKTIFIKSKNKKVYSNFNNHYGTLSVNVRKSSDLQYRVLGLCYGCVKNGQYASIVQR